MEFELIFVVILIVSTVFTLWALFRKLKTGLEKEASAFATSQSDANTYSINIPQNRGVDNAGAEGIYPGDLAPPPYDYLEAPPSYEDVVKIKLPGVHTYSESNVVEIDQRTTH